MDIQSQILLLLEEEELYWFKWSHEKWLHEGDNNTEFFHRIAKQKDDEVVEGDSNMLEHATEFYKNLFGPEQNHPFPLDPDQWDSCELVQEFENNLLTRPFTEEEIKEALFQMEKNKAAGPDSIPIEFYQSCWDIIKHDIIVLFEDFHQGNLDVKRLNYGIITLLPKVTDA